MTGLKMNREKTGERNSYLIFSLLILLSVFQYGIRKICGFTMYPDEFGYWASASELAGYDWSEIASMGSYYSFGYSLILFPILLLFKNGVTIYRVAVFINILLMCIGIFLCRKILSILFPDMGRNEKVFASGIAIFYPAWIFYAQTTMTEGLLFFLFMLIVYLLLEFMEKQTVKRALAMAVVFVYMYCVHMRTVGIIAAGLVAILGWAVSGKGKKKPLLFFAAAFVCMGVIAFFLKRKVIIEVFSYADKEILSGNDYGSQWGKFENIFTEEGFRTLFYGIVGKIFYLGMASLGTFYWAMGWCIKEIVLEVKSVMHYAKSTNKKRTEGQKGNYQISIKTVAAFFLLSASAGEILISSIYMNGAGNIDCLVYGRYNEFLVPVALAAGVAIMLKSQFLFRGTLLFGTAMGCMMEYLLYIVNKYSLQGFRGYHAAGMSYLLEEKLLQEGSFDISLFFHNTYILTVGCMIGAVTLIWTARQRKSFVWVLSGILFLETVAGMQISSHYVYSVNNTNFGNLVIADIIMENEKEGMKIGYLDEGKPAFVGLIQMQLQEKTIHVIREETILEGLEELPDFLITHIETKQEEILLKFYEKKASTNTFCLYIKKKKEAEIKDETDYSDTML